MQEFNAYAAFRYRIVLINDFGKSGTAAESRRILKLRK